MVLTNKKWEKHMEEKYDSIDILNELKRIILEEDISTVFQPIVNLKTGNIIGYEALTRGPVKSPLCSPSELFKAAEQYSLLWDLEFLCRTKAIEKGSSISPDKYLFINVDPLVLKDDKFKKGFTKEYLKSHRISPSSIIFEITERTCIEDFLSFKYALNNYTEQGYKIAIDDTGAGYSGLKMLTETKPNYVKVDMDIIRNIHKDNFKKSLIKSFVELSEVTDMKLIAEGIECEEELIALMELGVYGGQGFFLQRPAGTFLDISENVKNTILKYNRLCNLNSNNAINHIGQIALCQDYCTLNTTCHFLKDEIDKKSKEGVPVVSDGIPIGLVMKHSLNSVLATNYGVSVFSKRPISLIMDHSPLTVDYFTPIIETAKIAMGRSSDTVYDIVVVTNNGKYYGIVTIKDLLEYAMKLQYNYAKNLNPLTGLPGNEIIENNLSNIISYEKSCCILYLDLNNFKVYNDIYGFENGDKILKFTADTIFHHTKKSFPYNSFVGHIGGDDFVVIVEDLEDNCKALCEDIIFEFHNKIVDYYNEKHKSLGYVESTNRYGETAIFPLTGISIAGLIGNASKLNSVDNLAMKISAIKKEVKANSSSFYKIEKIN